MTKGTHVAPPVLPICLPPISLCPAWLRVGLSKELVLQLFVDFLFRFPLTEMEVSMHIRMP